MCEANVYFKEKSDSDDIKLLMESVDIIQPYKEGLKLVDIFGNQKFIQARIKDMALLQHRIVLEPLPKED